MRAGWHGAGAFLVARAVRARRHLGVPVLAPSDAFGARHFAHGNVGCVVDWLAGAFEASPEQLAAYMFACMPPTLRSAYANRANASLR